MIVGDGDINIGINEVQLEAILEKVKDGKDEWKKKYEEVVIALGELRNDIGNEQEINEAILDFNNGDFKQAINYRKRYAASLKSDIQKAEQNYYELGNIYLLDSDYVSTLLNYELARSLSENQNKYADEIANVLVRLGELDRAETVLLENAESANELLDVPIVGGYALAWLSLIKFYISKGAFEKAQSVINVIKPILEKHDYSDILDDSQNAISALSGGNQDGAKEKLRRMENNWGKYNAAIIEPANTLAQSYNAEGEHVEAEYLYKHVLEVIKSTGDEVDLFNQGIANINYLFNQFSLGKYNNVEESLDIAINSIGKGHNIVTTILPKAIQKYLDAVMFTEVKKYGSIYLDILESEEERNADAINDTKKLLRDIETI
jgi:hypothetical protein